MLLKQEFVDSLKCPKTGEGLKQKNENTLVTESGQTYKIVNGIPRFVEDDSYTESFSFEWTTHHKSQYDEEFPSQKEIKPKFIPLNEYTKDFNHEWKNHPFTKSFDVSNKTETYETFYIKTGVKPESLKGKKKF